MNSPSLVLASRSPRRAALLESLGLAFEVRASDHEERWVQGEAPEAYARRMATEKLLATPRSTGEVRLAADTVVWIDAQQPPLEKPADREEARRMLRRLQEVKYHRVTTGFALDASPDPGETAAPIVRSVTTEVEFRRIDDAELEAYLEGGEWSDKAGGYGIQAGAASFVPGIRGSYTNVVGLPLAELVNALRGRALLPFEGLEATS